MDATSWQPLIINAAITGMVPQKKDNPHIPLSPEEIITDAKRCYDAGASILHLHAREPDGKPTYCKELYNEIMTGVREECPGVMISASCSGRTHNEFWQRSQVLDNLPDLASLTLGSMNFPNVASVNSPQMVEQLATAMRDREIIPEMEIFELGMAEYSHHLIKKKVIVAPFYANLLLGSLGTISATAENLCMLVRALPANTTWAVAGIGRFQFKMNALAVVMGGHVRVGLEDAIYTDWETKTPATNVGLIERINKIAESVGRPISTVEQTRALLDRSQANVIPMHTNVAAQTQQRKVA